MSDCILIPDGASSDRRPAPGPPPRTNPDASGSARTNRAPGHAHAQPPSAAAATFVPAASVGQPAANRTLSPGKGRSGALTSRARLPDPGLAAARPPRGPRDANFISREHKPLADAGGSGRERSLSVNSADAGAEQEDHLLLDYLAELGEAAPLSRQPSPERDAGAGVLPSPTTPWTPDAGAMPTTDAEPSPAADTPEASPVSPLPEQPIKGIVGTTADKKYDDAGGFERLKEFNMDSFLATIQKMGAKGLARNRQRGILKDLAKEMEAKICDNLKVLAPFVAQNTGDWKAIDPTPSLPPKLAQQLQTFLSSFHHDELAVLYMNSLYAAVTSELLDVKVHHAGSGASDRRILMRLIEGIVPEVLYRELPSDLDAEAERGKSVLEVVWKKAQGDEIETLGGYVAWAMSNQRADVGAPATEKSPKQRAGLLPPRTVAAFYRCFLEDHAIVELEMDASAFPLWLGLICGTTMDCLKQLTNPNLRNVSYKFPGHIPRDQFEAHLKYVSKARIGLAKSGGRSGTRRAPKEGGKTVDPVKMQVDLYEGCKAALFPPASVAQEKAAGDASLAALVLDDGGSDVSQPKLFETWYAAQKKNAAVPYVGPEYQSLLLALLASRNEPGVYLAWTRIAGDDWAGNGAFIAFLESVARQRKAARGAGLPDLPTAKDRWTSLDKRRLKHALEGFANSAALELDDLTKRKRLGKQSDGDGARRRQIEGTAKGISSLLAAFPREGSMLWAVLRFAWRMLLFLVAIVFGVSALTNAFPQLTRMRLKPDAPIVKDIEDCRGVHGKTWCSAREATASAVRASRDSLSSVVAPVFEAHVQPLYDNHVRPLYDAYGAPVARQAAEYLPQIRDVLQPAVVAAGAGVLQGVTMLEDTADNVVGWTMNQDWAKLSADGLDAAQKTARLVRQKTGEGWEAAKPHVLSATERIGLAAQSAYDKAMEVPALSKAAGFLHQNVVGPVSRTWEAVTPQASLAGELWLNGTKAAYLFLRRKHPKFPGETWEQKFAEESVLEDIYNAADFLAIRAVDYSRAARHRLSGWGSLAWKKWDAFVGWLEDSVGIEFGDLDLDLDFSSSPPEAPAKEEPVPADPAPELPAVEWEPIDADDQRVICGLAICIMALMTMLSTLQLAAVSGADAAAEDPHPPAEPDLELEERVVEGLNEVEQEEAPAVLETSGEDIFEDVQVEAPAVHTPEPDSDQTDGMDSVLEAGW
ncbi:hypothetical protein DFJ74DRAFT_707208 [Hyaloraphidium curvatum]|nr:hypothetical protein DFJ74DRAFT_707208 [Hyaloraphidium curvatum]